VEHPARMGLETRIAALQWAPSYKRATWMQAPLALLSLLSGVVAWFTDGGVGRLVAAVLIGAVVPFTLLGLMHTKRQLLSAGRGLAAVRLTRIRMCGHALEAARPEGRLAATSLASGLLLEPYRVGVWTAVERPASEPEH